MTRSLTSLRKSNALKRSFHVPTLLIVLLIAPSLALAQTYGTSSHNVTVTVATINRVDVSAGSVSISVTGSAAVAGQNLLGSVSDATTTLYWASNSSARKITVQTNVGAPKHTLKLYALNATHGTPQPEATLSTTPTDFILNVGRTLGSCSLRYTGIVLASEGTGTDTHTITFSITNQ